MYGGPWDGRAFISCLLPYLPFTHLFYVNHVSIRNISPFRVFVFGLNLKLMFKQASLFGGAARVDIPASWIDASTVRTVPDHQEVFVNESGDMSVIIEIMERQSSVADEQAGKFFFTDLASADAANSAEVLESRVVGPREFLGTIAVECFVRGSQVIAKSGPHSPAHPIDVRMTIIRSKQFQSDILVTLHSVPGMIVADSVFRQISESLEFLDPDLFVS